MLWDSILRGLKTDASMGLVDQQELGPWDMWASTQLRNCECSHLLTSFGRMLGSMLNLSHKYRIVMGW